MTAQCETSAYGSYRLLFQNKAKARNIAPREHQNLAYSCCFSVRNRENRFSKRHKYAIVF